MRISTTGNPLGLQIGEVITVRRTCIVEYIENEKQLIFTDFQQSARVIGCIKRALGTYVPGGSTYSLGYEPDFDPPYLRVSKYVWLYQIRIAMHGAILLVHPDDIEI
jgi:hypothetical protein